MRTSKYILRRAGILKLFVGLVVSFLLTSCFLQPDDAPVKNEQILPDAVDVVVHVDEDEVITENYLGNGVQWDPYQLDYGKVELSISDADWKKLYARLDFMRPQVMRVMINTASAIEGDTLSLEKGLENIIPILNYCQSRGVIVTFGDWGGQMVDAEADSISERNIAYAARYLDFLINEKGFTSIKYYNMINEPNGFWSVTDGKYELWQQAAASFQEELVSLGLTDKVSIMGPDIAIWDSKETNWISNTEADFGKAIGLYDIHTYPSKSTVNSGEYAKIIRTYKNEVPEGTPIIMGEIGFKFVSEEDADLNKENIERAKAKPYASVEDSQMFVYDHVYGIDMADALFQTVNEGYSGCVVWMLDDAMHSKEEKHKLKVWGFWNILGEEFFGAEEEEVRPWYYAWSLLTKYMPTGSEILNTSTEGDDKVKAVVSRRGAYHMLAFVNVGQENKTVRLSLEDLPELEGMKKFMYSKEHKKTEGDFRILPNQQNMSIDPSEELVLELGPETLVVMTNFPY